MSPWDRRIARAEELEKEYPAAAELLRFYVALARFQRGVAADFRTLPEAPPDLSLHPARLPAAVRPYCGRLLTLMRDAGPPMLSHAATQLQISEDWDPADPAPRFVARVLMQPYAQRLASRTRGAPVEMEPICPFCRERPVVAVLRPEGEGGKRSLLCSLCATEWSFRRVLCPGCGEEDQQKLPVYTATEFPHIRIEACDTCRTYLKSVDLTRNGLAVPEVDELAAVPLDIWAAERDYLKLQPNLFGL